MKPEHVLSNPAARVQLDFPVHFIGWYRGNGLRMPHSRRTLLINRSKFQRDRRATERVLRELAAVAESLDFDVVCYPAHRDSGRQHARALARGLAGEFDCDVVGPSMLREVSLRGRKVLIVDDVMNTGRTLRRLHARLAPHNPREVWGLVYLVTRMSPERA